MSRILIKNVLLFSREFIYGGISKYLLVVVENAFFIPTKKKEKGMFEKYSYSLNFFSLSL